MPPHREYKPARAQRGGHAQRRVEYGVACGVVDGGPRPTGLGTPMMAAMPPPGQTMSVVFAPSPSSGPVQMPTPMTGGGAMPMPSPAVIPGVVPPPGNMMVMPSPSLGAGAVPQILRFNGYGEFSGLLYHSPHTVLYQEELYPTALHLFEASKFFDHRPDLAERIRQCERVEEVTAISAELADFTRRDWASIIAKLFFKFVLFDISLYLVQHMHGCGPSARCGERLFDQDHPILR